MAIRIGLNGFGRIGRYLLRLLADKQDVELCVVNARADNASLAYLLKYDSVHRTFPAAVEANEQGFLLNGRQITVTRAQVGEWAWEKYGVDLVVESTGKIKDRAGLERHLACGAKKVLISAPSADADLTVVMGVNHQRYDPAVHQIISNASCTTNCLAPTAKVLHDHFGIRRGLMTTIHSYTMSQRILDGSHKDLRRGRAAAVSMLPTSTGAAKALALVLPELAGKIAGMAVRIPTPNVSLVDLACELERDVTVQEVNAAFEHASKTSLKECLGYTDEALVSCDFIGSAYAGVVDAQCTSVVDKRMAKVIVWYDNEAGFCNQLLRLVRLTGASL